MALSPTLSATQGRDLGKVTAISPHDVSAEFWTRLLAGTDASPIPGARTLYICDAGGTEHRWTVVALRSGGEGNVDLRNSHCVHWTMFALSYGDILSRFGTAGDTFDISACTWGGRTGVLESDETQLVSAEQDRLGLSDGVVRIPAITKPQLRVPASPRERPAPVSADLARTLGMSPGEISQMLHISDRSFRNWQQGARIRLTNEKRLLWLRQIAKLVESARGAGNVRTWFLTPVLQGETPFDLLKAGKLDTVARIAAAEFERRPQARAVTPAERDALGFPYNAFDATEQEFVDLERILGDD